MYGLADISLFEPVTSSRCSVFNDAYADVVAASDPLATHQERVMQLAVANPVDEIPEGGTLVVEEAKEPEVQELSEAEQRWKTISKRVFQAYHIIKSIDAYVDDLCYRPEESATLDRFADKFGKRVLSIKGMVSNILSNISSLGGSDE